MAGAGVVLWTFSSLIRDDPRHPAPRHMAPNPPGRSGKTRLLSGRIHAGGCRSADAVAVRAGGDRRSAAKVILAVIPQLGEVIGMPALCRDIVPALGLGLSLFVLFFTLTSERVSQAGLPQMARRAVSPRCGG